MNNILLKIKKAGLVGRGGACFPVARKWEMVNYASGKIKYVVCNGAEGEPGVKKDGYILENYPEKVIDGIELALNFLNAEKAIIYINHDYNKKLGKKLNELILGKKIELFPKKINAGYIGGEESSILNSIEEYDSKGFLKRIEPRLKPPFPPFSGLRNIPTLINNVETFYNISLVNSDEFKNKRFYTINGNTLNTGVYNLSDNLSIKNILKKTNNYPNFPFFVQVGGDASGEVLNEKQFNNLVTGSGSITIYNIEKHKPINLIKNWLNFFKDESCGQCTPCREGTYRLLEIINSSNPDWDLFADLLINLRDSSFCGLGCAVPIAVTSYIKNVLSTMPDNKIKLKGFDKKLVCECFE